MTQVGPLAGGVILVLLTGGCATEDYVNKQVAPVQAQASEAQGTAAEALGRANSAHKLAEGKFLFEEVLSDDSVKFPLNGNDLSPEARSRLDELVQKLKSENKNVYLEIQGFTDSSGDSKYNHKLGEARAESVRRYLHQGGVALNRMATISYGEEDPVAPNDTPDGRARNRRVAIVVLV
jgi:outer membrane protein OmpA-like peptidoglycan-associated protein